MAVFGDDDLGDALFRGDFLVVFVAVEEHDDIGVLFDGAGIPEVGEHRAFVGAVFGSAGELGAADHGDLQFLCHELESPGDIRHFLHPVVLMLLALHELQVVDDDEAEVFHPAELGLHAGDGDARGVVDQV